VERALPLPSIGIVHALKNQLSNHSEKQERDSVAAFKVLISHIHEETPIAQVLQDWVESTFAGQTDVFVLTDDEIIVSDSAWLEKVDETMEGANALLPLISSTSIQTPWINFELGCAWTKGIFILPICHSGVRTANLPQPLSMFQALDLDEGNFPEALFTLLGKELGIRKIPRINFAEMAGEIQKARKALLPRTSEKKEIPQPVTHEAPRSHQPSEEKVTPQPVSQQTPRSRQPSEKKEIPQPVIQDDRCLDQTHEKILLILADADTVGFTAAVLAEHFKIQESKIKSYLKKLTEEKYVYAGHPGEGERRYKLTQQGKTYLEEYGLI
jgi:predicted transcriptional regulator